MRAILIGVAVLSAAMPAAWCEGLPQVDVLALRDSGRATDAPPDSYSRRVMAHTRRLAKLGDPVSQHNLAVMHYYRTEYDKAFYWFRRAAKRGDRRSQYGLGILHATGRGTAGNQDLALKWVRKSADKGFAPAQFYLGIIYYHGYGVSPDPAAEAYWYRKAAEQGNAN